MCAAAALLLVVGLVSSLVLKAEADSERDVARRERANVLRLSAFQRLDDLNKEVDDLWPAHPERIPAHDAWLERARELVAGLEGHRAQLAELERRALAQTDEEREAERRSHPRFGELEALQAKLAALEKAQAMREGNADVEEAELDEASLPVDADGLNGLAWPLIDPERTTFGGEARGLALARRAFERAANDEERATIGDTLAWALFANGLDGDAVAASETALAAVGKERHEEYLVYLERLGKEIEAARRGDALGTLDAEVSALEAEVSRRRTWRFGNTDDTWWHAQLVKLVGEIEAFADPEAGLMAGISPEHGWGIARRREWAASVAGRTVSGKEAARRWAEAIASIEDPDACPAYGGLRIEPQIGLVPIDRDPGSGLWEFGHPLSGEVPERSDDGTLVLTEETGLVFVLLPGGTFSMGAQGTDPKGANYAPQAHDLEGPVHEVTLSPFFLAKYEMTQGQWERFTGRNPSQYNPQTYGRIWNAAGLPGDLSHPVERVSWFACTETMGRLGLVLPSEAQWEYGARGGTTSAWWTGDEGESLAGAANLSDLHARAHGGGPWGNHEEWLDDGNTVHARVGSYAPNPFGLHDVAGNVWEWCRDGSDGGLYGPGPAQDPVFDPSGFSLRVSRGAGFPDAAANARSANRRTDTPEIADGTIGLRPARALRSP